LGSWAVLPNLINNPKNDEKNGEWRENAEEPNDEGDKPPVRESCEGLGIPIRWGRRVDGDHTYL